MRRPPNRVRRDTTDSEDRLRQTRERELINAMMVWGQYAACKRAGLDFTRDPTRGHIDNDRWLAQAKSVCVTCPVRLKCLQHALAYPEKVGVWGGLSPEEREAL